MCSNSAKTTPAIRSEYATEVAVFCFRQPYSCSGPLLLYHFVAVPYFGGGKPATPEGVRVSAVNAVLSKDRSDSLDKQRT